MIVNKNGTSKESHSDRVVVSSDPEVSAKASGGVSRRRDFGDTIRNSL